MRKPCKCLMHYFIIKNIGLKKNLYEERFIKLSCSTHCIEWIAIGRPRPLASLPMSWGLVGLLTSSYHPKNKLKTINVIWKNSRKWGGHFLSHSHKPESNMVHTELFIMRSALAPFLSHKHPYCLSIFRMPVARRSLPAPRPWWPLGLVGT